MSVDPFRRFRPKSELALLARASNIIRDIVSDGNLGKGTQTNALWLETSKNCSGVRLSCSPSLTRQALVGSGAIAGVRVFTREGLTSPPRSNVDAQKGAAARMCFSRRVKVRK